MDRLRRLDRLFAQKIFGCTVYETTDPEGPDLVCTCGKDPFDRPHAIRIDHCCEGACRAEGFDALLPRYTRSLDAAWEGAERVARIQIEAGSEDWTSGFGVEFVYAPAIGAGPSLHAAVGGSYPMEWAAHEARADHPAEALVLACLSAVGCSEDELA